MKRFVPDPAQRVELRAKRKMLLSNSIPHISVEEEEEILRRIKGKITFYSLTLRKVNPETVSSSFIVRTYKPIKWRDFIIRVALALEEVL